MFLQWLQEIFLALPQTVFSHHHDAYKFELVYFLQNQHGYSNLHCILHIVLGSVILNSVIHQEGLILTASLDDVCSHAEKKNSINLI